MNFSIEAFAAGWLRLRFLAASVAAPLAGGCALHPVQQDVTRIATQQIVNQIRCEARLAVLDKAIADLRKTALELSQQDVPPAAAKRSAAAIASLNGIAADLSSQRGQEGPIRFDPLLLPTDDAVRFYNRYINTVIAYDFRFEITEENKAFATADPVRLISGGFAGLGVSTTGTLNRNNVRQFALSDSFEYLMFNEELKCASNDYLADNFVYPVAGNVGLKNAIETFIDLYEDSPLKPNKEANVFADTLRFTTRLDGSIGPRIRIVPVGSSVGLNSPASADFSAYRSDVHTLTVGIAKQPDGTIPLLEERRIRRSPPGKRFAPRVSAGRVKNGVQKQNEDAAFRAINGIIIRNFYENSRLLQVR